MTDLSRFLSAPRTSNATDRVVRLAGRQGGVIGRAQLRECGLSDAMVARWLRTGRLHRIHPRVYALGHPALSLRGRLCAALLYAGPGAMLSHATAAWWWALLRDQPKHIHVTAPGRCSSLTAVHVHHPRVLERVRHRGLPVTAVPRTLLDLAPTVPFGVLRRALSEAVYLRLTTLDDVATQPSRGHHGGAPLCTALERHNPQLARTLSVLEDCFLALCEASGLPPPEVNVKVCGLMVDALWRQNRVIVELDGHASHANPAAIERDRRRDLALRTAGFYVLRYTWQQVTEEAALVAADLRARLRP